LRRLFAWLRRPWFPRHRQTVTAPAAEGAQPPPPEQPVYCPSCRFMLPNPDRGWLYCAHCHWSKRWPPEPEAPRKYYPAVKLRWPTPTRSQRRR
jgi:hypothetical protein